MFGAGMLPPKLIEMAEKGSTDKLSFWHHVKPNRDWRKGALGPRGKRWVAIYVCEHDRAVVRESGYHEMPFYAPRWEVDTGQTYGRGPAMTALADARKVNLMEAANLRAGQKAGDPTLLAPDKDAWPLNGVVRPGEVVYGGVDLQGRPLIRPLDNWSGTGLTLEMQQAAIEHIRDAFHWSLMNLAGRTGMTATEIIERQEEKLRLMAPHMGRVQSEFLAPKIARRFHLLWRAGQLPPPPPELAREDVELNVEYLSAAAMAQKSAKGASVVRLLQTVTPLAEIKPEVMDRISGDDALEVLAEAFGTPARVLRSREDAAAIAEARAAQQQAMMALQAGQAAGGIAKDVAQAQAAGGAGG
jgi:hypothetical protein